MLKPYENPLLVVLLATKYESIVLDVIRLATSLVNQIYLKSEGDIQEIQILVAHMDRVSTPAQMTNVIPNHMLSEGAAGFSFFWTSQDKLVIEDAQEDTHFSSQEDSGTLSIRLYETIPQQQLQDASTYSEFNIQLANTTFSTGRPNTIWTNDVTFELLAANVKPVTRRCASSLPRYIEHQNVRLDIEGMQGRFELQTYSKEARTELTSWRRVAEVSGNIVKRLEGGDTLLPASRELELAIAQVPPSEHGHFEVWAEIASKEANLESKSELPNNTRLIKVVGGGGGWGEKQGLIALDPNSVPHRDISDTFDLEDMFPKSCEVGDELRFIMVSTRQMDLGKSGANNAEASRKPRKKLPGYTTFGFGTIGNNGMASLEDDGDNSLSKSQILKGHFGAMSRHIFYEHRSTTKITGMAGGDVETLTHGTDLPPYTHYSTGNAPVARTKSPSHVRDTHVADAAVRKILETTVSDIKIKQKTNKPKTRRPGSKEAPAKAFFHHPIPKLPAFYRPNLPNTIERRPSPSSQQDRQKRVWMPLARLVRANQKFNAPSSMKQVSKPQEEQGD